MSYTLLNDMLAEAIINDVRAGMTYKDAATRAKVGERTLYRWLDRGRSAARTQANGGLVADSERPFLDLLTGVEESRATARGRAVAVLTGVLVDESADRALRVKVAMWFLERTDPAEWGRRWAPDLAPESEGDLDLDVEMARAAELIAAAERRLALPAPPAADDD